MRCQLSGLSMYGSWYSLHRVTALVIASALFSSLVRADVVEPPDESQVSAVARHIQAAAAMRVTWSAMLDALAHKDTQRALGFVLPERRAEFERLISGAARLRRLDEARGQGGALPCKLSSETTGGCIVIVPTADGAFEDIHIPFFLRGGVWYISL